MNDTIYLGVKGSVVAHDRATGDILWSTRLKGSRFVVVVLDDDLVLAHTRGELFALDPLTGRIKWRNGLAGFGYGYATIASANIGTNQAVAAIKNIMNDQASSGGAGSAGVT